MRKISDQNVLSNNCYESSVMCVRSFGLIVLLLSFISTPLKAEQRGGSCMAGTALNGLIEGDLGLAPNTTFDRLLCFEVNNDQSVERYEVAGSAVPIAFSEQLLDTDNLVVVGPGNRIIASGFDILARWGGPLNNAALPIQWLEIEIPVRVGPDSINQYELRHYQQPVNSTDPYAINVQEDQNTITVDTGVASFDLSKLNPRLIDAIAVALDDTGSLTEIYTDTTEAGPRLAYRNALNELRIIGGAGRENWSTDVIFSSSFENVTDQQNGQVVIDGVGLQVRSQTDVETSVWAQGHFVSDDGSSLCQNNVPQAYEQFGFSIVLTFQRASRDIDMAFEFRNECSDAGGGPFTDQMVSVEEVSWALPLSMPLSIPALAYDDQVVIAATTDTSVAINQGKGGESNGQWARQVQAQVNNQAVDSAEFYADAMTSGHNQNLLASIQMPYMRFREPQAIEVHGSSLNAYFVSELITVGEGKGIWNKTRFNFVPLSNQSVPIETTISNLKLSTYLKQERGLLVRANLDDLNQAAVLPNLGNDLQSGFKSGYLGWLELLHNQTVSEDSANPGQWLRNKTFGSQYWPDTGSADPFGIDADRPNNSFSGMNYWDPAGIEILEYMRSGDPKWAWELAIPQYKTIMHSAYLNIGYRTHGNRAGVAVQSGGPGCLLIESPPGSGNVIIDNCMASGSGGGQWHRSNFGSDDYTYASYIDLAYLARPDILLSERFAMAGSMLVSRYDQNIAEGNREDAVNVINHTRQIIQHMEMLSNCAQFVAGNQGAVCDQILKSVVTELVNDNMTPGLLCQGYPGLINGMGNGDIPSARVDELRQCLTPQQFMVNSLMYPFLYQFMLNNPQSTLASDVMNVLESISQVYMNYGLPTTGGGAIDPNGGWWSRMFCQLDNTGTIINSCAASLDSDGNTTMWNFNKPHTAAVTFMGAQLNSNSCNLFVNLFNANGFVGVPGTGSLWDDAGHFNLAGWWKGTAQMMQSMVFAVGLYDQCLTP